MSALSFSHSSSCYLCLLVVALFHLCLSDQNSDDVLCIKEERQALLQFRHHLIDEGDRLSSWVDEKNDCCKWAGIVCDNMTGHVHQIHLNGPLLPESFTEEFSKQQLKGDLSPSLLDLKHLKHLDLSSNNFGQIQIPEFIGSLGNLRYLNLSNSNFGGIIPPKLGNLSDLHTLCLGSFQDYYWWDKSTSVMNMEWLSNLRLLRHLDMSNVDLSKAMDWLKVINTLPSLAELHLKYTNLFDAHPHVPTLNITSLILLDLSENEFIDHSLVPQWIFSITSLASLDLSRCDFNSLIPSSSAHSFRNLTSLKWLYLYQNNFMNSSLVLKELSSGVGSNLISLDISDCDISSTALDSLHNLTSLLSLEMSGNQLTNIIPKSLGNLCNLREIDLSSNYFQNTSLTYLLESFLECKSPRLESLSISSSGLSGHLPNQLGQLMHMKHLNLWYNNISGTIPDSIRLLSFLRTLDLSDNQISGPIPFSIGRLSLLDVLDLSNNQLNGSLLDSIGRLSLLRRLDLSYNQLNGSLPDSIGRLSLLRRLDLSYNQFNGSLPNSLGQLSKLERLYFSSNFLTGVVTEIHFVKLVRLKVLDGGGNNIILRLRLANWIPPYQLERIFLNSWSLGPLFPSWLISQRELIALDISNTNNSSPMPESFWKSFPNLNYLDMSKNQMQGTLNLSAIPTVLSTLDLSSNRFEGELPDILNGSNLEYLDLSSNFFVGSLHHLLCSDGVKAIDKLNLGNNSLAGVIPECWEKSQRLSYVNLENNNFSGGIPRTLGRMGNIQSLIMRGNKLEGKLPASLMNLTHLEILDLSGNELAGSIPSWVGTKLSSLGLLNLRSNKFVGKIPREVCYLTHIKILDLSNNKLTGDIPKCFNNFSVLSGKETISGDEFSILTFEQVFFSIPLVMKGHEYMYHRILNLMRLLDLSNNELVGHIPSELTTLIKLKSLNLSRNHLTGRIPEKIGDLKELESFDLSLNKLSGGLPMSLSSLNLLSSFNVSYNKLTGNIPSSTQLQSLNESCFVGNELCGDPLTEHCPRVEAPDIDNEDDDGSDGENWGLIISVLSGFIVGFWVILAPLIVSRSWRIAYFRFLSELGYMVYDVMHKMFSR